MSIDAASGGVLTNQFGGLYEPGKAYSITKKLQVAEKIRELFAATGRYPTNVEVGQLCCVGDRFVAKVRREMEEHNRVLHPDEIVQRRATGVGSIALDEDDESVLLFLRYTDPTRSNQSYVEHLFYQTGKVVSESLISDWFAHRFDHSGKFKVPDLVAMDKFKPENISKYLFHVAFVASITDWTRFKFGDEKHLDGAEIYKKKVRGDPFTGIVPSILVGGDFRKRYNINAIMSLCPLKPPLFISIEEETNDAASFLGVILSALDAGFFNFGDIFVLDNWTGHSNGEADILEELLWNYLDRTALCASSSSSFPLGHRSSIPLSSFSRFLSSGSSGRPLWVFGETHISRETLHTKSSRR